MKAIRPQPPYSPTVPRRTGRHSRRKARTGDWAEKTSGRPDIPLDQRLAESILLSSRLSKLPVIGREQPEDVIRMVPEEIIPILQDAGIEFVLAGAHGIGGWMAETRATQDVDVIIRLRDSRRAADVVLQKMPHLELEKHPDVWRFKDGEQYVLDLILTRAPLFKRVLKEYHEIALKRRRVKVPSLEAALAMKFAAMTGHWRNQGKKFRDAADLISMISVNKQIDLDLLRELGELVYPGGGDDVLRYVDDVRNGRRLEI